MKKAFILGIILASFILFISLPITQATSPVAEQFVINDELEECKTGQVGDEHASNWKPFKEGLLAHQVRGYLLSTDRKYGELLCDNLGHKYEGILNLSSGEESKITLYVNHETDTCKVFIMNMYLRDYNKQYNENWTHLSEGDQVQLSKSEYGNLLYGQYVFDRACSNIGYTYTGDLKVNVSRIYQPKEDHFDFKWLIPFIVLTIIMIYLLYNTFKFRKEFSWKELLRPSWKKLILFVIIFLVLPFPYFAELVSSSGAREMALVPLISPMIISSFMQGSAQPIVLSILLIIAVTSYLISALLVSTLSKLGVKLPTIKYPKIKLPTYERKEPILKKITIEIPENRGLAAFAYIFNLFFGWSGYIAFLMAKDKYTKFHGIQAFLLGIIAGVVNVTAILLSTALLFPRSVIDFPTLIIEMKSFFMTLFYTIISINAIYILLSIGLAILAYKGRLFKIPLIGKYCLSFMRRFESMKKSKRRWPFNYIRTRRDVFRFILFYVLVTLPIIFIILLLLFRII